MRQRALVLSLAAALVSITLARAGTVPSSIALTRHDGVAVRHAPSPGARVITTLPAESQVQVLHRAHTWSRVRVWTTTVGWALSRDLVIARPWHTVSHYVPPALPPSALHAWAPMPLQVQAVSEESVPISTLPGGARVGTLPVGRRFSIDAWRQDSTGLVWYHTQRGWLPSGAIRFVSRTRAPASAANRTLVDPVRGKGMWLTEGTVADTDARALVTAATRLRLTHLYVEFADSPLGIYGTQGMSKLLLAAHRRHIAVLAWVFPYMRDVAADVMLTRRVAAYRSASGQRFDGIALDIEDDIHWTNVRAYSQLVRAYLGPHELIVGVVWDPQGFPNYPYRAVAESDDVLAPMDYWHDRQGSTGWAYPSIPYGDVYTQRFATDSIARIESAMGSSAVPIEPIGQMFDNFGRYGLGPEAPSAAEIGGFLRGCTAAHVWGVSFFQWMTATPAEWSVFKRWSSP